MRADGDNIGLAVLAVVLAVFALSLGDASIKRFSVDFTLWQIFVVRSALAVPVLIAVAKARDRSLSLRPGILGWTAVRSLLLVFMWVAYYVALPHTELSVAAAAYYTTPIFITLLAALLVGDRVGAAGWTAVFLGFCGVLLILRPRADAFNAHTLLPLISAVLYAFAMILTRTKCRDEHPLVLSLALNLTFVAVGAAATLLTALWGPTTAGGETQGFLHGPWAAMGTREWLVMGLLATAILVGSVCAAVAYQAGPPAIVATFDFSYLAFAALWGLLFFGEVPDGVTVAGMVLIAVAGILAVRR